MNYQEFLPSDCLKPFIKCFYIYQSDSDIEFEDTVFPSGFTEIIFNLGDGSWASLVDNIFHKTPKIELWGQITKPLTIKSKGKNIMLGIRFFSHSITCFLKEEAILFNNQVSDLYEVLGSPVKNLHQRLLETPDLQNRINLVEIFFLYQLKVNAKTNHKIEEISQILNKLKNNPTALNINSISQNHGITPRYLRKLVLQHTGLSPKLYAKINRFQSGLSLISKTNKTFTDIAYETGYFDQSHFIKEFKLFTGTTPSSFSSNISLINQALL